MISTVKIELNKICRTTETVRTYKPDRQKRCFLVYSCIRSCRSQMRPPTHYGDIKAADFSDWLIDIGRVLPRVVHRVVMPSQASKYILSDLSLKWHLNSLALQIWVSFSFSIFIQTNVVALLIYFLVSHQSTPCWMWRLLQWWNTCHCCEMIHLQVCLSASQASTHSFSPLLPRWAKAPHLHRLQRHRLFSHMTSLPRGVCLSLWIPTKQALMAFLCLTWVNFIQLWKNKYTLWYKALYKMGKNSKNLSRHEKHWLLGSFAK